MLEQAVCDALATLNIPHVRQVIVGQYVVDVVLLGQRRIIECYGDFHHCNPAIYPNGPERPAQEGKREKDAHREQTLRAMGFDVAIVWERDINRDGALAVVLRLLSST